MIEFEKTKLDKVYLIRPSVFEDFRGEYIELFNKEIYKELTNGAEFIQDDISVSTKYVLRGIHGDSKTWKLVSCLCGRFYLVIVNCDTNSENFGKWQGFILSDRNRYQVLSPPNHGVAHLVMSDKAIFHYKQTTYYDPSIQFTYKWNDPKFNIWWPIKGPILSQRDEAGKYV